MLIINKLFRFLFTALIRLYQYTLSPLLGPSCRFYPSCSEYAHQAIMRHGPFRGLLLALKRILRCHPFHPGGVDPVPEPQRCEIQRIGLFRSDVKRKINKI